MRRFFIILLCLIPIGLYADTWFVGFTDKNGTKATLDTPNDYLSSRAIERRFAQNISIDSTDLPVSIVYLDSIKALGADIVYPLKWLNGVVVSFNSVDIENRILALSFVQILELTSHHNPTLNITKNKLPQPTATDFNQTTDNLSSEYHKMIGLDSLQRLGFYGEGKLISVIDNGFQDADTLPAFSSAMQQVIATYNIVNPSSSVYQKGSHGACVLSLLSAQTNDMIIGTATKAQYCLFVTENDDNERLLETDNLIRAFELADSIGTDIITVSLGYNSFDYDLGNFTINDLNGITTRCSRAAQIAAQKGILVCIAAGNEGNSSWKVITVPADADHIITVGGVDDKLQHSTFSSYGPTADGRIKPDVCVLATKVPIYYPNQFTRSNGTSFATPIIAGAAATLWSALPDLTAKQIRERIIKYSSQYNNPDNELGYGIPNFVSAYYDTPTEVEHLSTISDKDGFIGEFEVYTLTGTLVGRYNDKTSLRIISPGIYILKQGNRTIKIAL